jgi:hypothetical protein
MRAKSKIVSFSLSQMYASDLVKKKKKIKYLTAKHPCSYLLRGFFFEATAGSL